MTATGPWGTTTRAPPDAASRWAGATETATSRTGLHAPIGSTGGLSGLSRSSSQLSTRRAGAWTSRRRTARGSSHTTCQYEQSSTRVAAASPYRAGRGEVVQHGQSPRSNQSRVHTVTQPSALIPPTRHAPWPPSGRGTAATSPAFTMAGKVATAYDKIAFHRPGCSLQPPGSSWR
ncbi:hypothetical protein [Streptosporangium sp. OZ121]|uniref:hypothetical protein n=1 Tax=Streptosporangium sp. OZ121 TaxID=3444183 RepID=UPI003F7B1686